MRPPGRSSTSPRWRAARCWPGAWCGASARCGRWTGSTSPSPGGRSTGSSAPTEPGSPAPSGCCARCCARTAASPTSPGTTWPASPRRCGCASASPCRRPPSTTARPAASCSRCRVASTAWRCPGSGADCSKSSTWSTSATPSTGAIGTYSGGMQRRLDLAAALIHRPEVLFLDEPTTGLDPLSRASVWAEIRRLNAELGMTIFLTTQYLDEADALADRVGIIDRGRLVAEGTPDELKRSVGQDLIVADVDGAGPDRAGQVAGARRGRRRVVRGGQDRRQHQGRPGRAEPGGHRPRRDVAPGQEP